MVASKVADPHSSRVQLSEARRNRRPITTEKTEEAVVAPPEVSIQELGDCIWRDLPFATAEPTTTGREELVRLYSESKQRLVEMHHEVLNLVQVLLEESCEVDTVAPDASTAVATAIAVDEIRNLVSLAESAFVPIKPRRMTKEIGGPEGELYEHLEKEVNRLVDQFAENILNAFEVLQKRQVVGSIQWEGNTYPVCTCDFFKRAYVEQPITNSEKLVNTKTRRAKHSGRNVTETWKETTSVQVKRKLIRTEFAIMQIQLHACGSNEIYFPPQVKTIRESIPTWMHDVVRIVTGDQISGQVMEKDLETRSRTKERTVKRTYFYYDDPVITLGEYVLTGWGQAEIEQEDHRREAVRGEWLISLAIGMQFAGFVLLVAALITQSFAQWLGPLIALLGVIPCLIGLIESSASRGKPASAMYLAGGVSIMVAASIGAQLFVGGLLSGTLGVLGLGVLLLAVSYPIWGLMKRVADN